jgi:hypothetical protein
MKPMPFTLRLEPDVQAYIAALAPVVRRQVERDLEKLAARGDRSLPPLIGKVTGPVWQLRSHAEGHGEFRLFFYRDGESSFHVFLRRKRSLPGFRRRTAPKP